MTSNKRQANCSTTTKQTAEGQRN